jgi:lipopolysaccharide export LptBFGC system permease protein LptF
MEGKATPSFWLNGPPFFVLVFFLTSIVVLMSKIVQHWGSIQLLETLWQNNVDNRISTVDHEDIKPGG